MKPLSWSRAVALIVICLALCGPGWLLGAVGAATAPGSDPFAKWYGRAGGPVGADAISAIGASTSPASTAVQVQPFGRAGTPVGADAIEALSHVTHEALAKNAFDGWYGRAGGPVNALSVPAHDRAATPAVAAQRRDYVWEVVGPSVRTVATGGCVRVGTWVSNATDLPCGAPTEATAKRPEPVQAVPLPPPATPKEEKSARAEAAPAPVREPAAPDTVPAPRAVPAQPEAATPPPPVPVAQPAPQHAEAPLHVTLEAETYFGFNEYRLKPGGQTKLDQLLAELSERQFDTIVVTGHTDRMGTKAYNEKLSGRRAQSVKEYLTKQGVDAKRIQTHGVGEVDPVTLPGACEGLDRAKTIQCLAPDRRVELDVIGVHQR